MLFTVEEIELMKARLRSGAKKSHVHFRDPVSSPHSACDLLNHPPSSSSETMPLPSTSMVSFAPLITASYPESGHASSKDSLSDKNRPDASLLSLLTEKDK
ncbi:hypothetical protein L1987_33748 [Smallanthus sonchifolius]|uniref:Uncharacterized protein n=1 Tax=Smallanthus sonchifolius TaxID=185202 RepID=A0ACB9HSK8_9ASTR|nr:hypothetical protein L1987_33748 [Smallanthus sonchifolius]